jgi:hypothetical protein
MNSGSSRMKLEVNTIYIANSFKMCVYINTYVFLHRMCVHITYLLGINKIILIINYNALFFLKETQFTKAVEFWK